MVVPKRAKSSTRRFMVSSGIGLEKSSYSLQYLQARLQRRIGMMCAITGWSVEATPLAIMMISRTRRFAAMTRRRTALDVIDIPLPFDYNTLTHDSGKPAPLFGE